MKKFEVTVSWIEGINTLHKTLEIEAESPQAANKKAIGRLSKSMFGAKIQHVNAIEKGSRKRD